MKRKFAILIDGAFLVKRLQVLLARREIAVGDVQSECSRIQALPELADRELLRVFFYDAPPAHGAQTNPVSSAIVNYGASDVARRAASLHDAIEQSADFALRLGTIEFRGWSLQPAGWRKALACQPLLATSVKPRFQQKGVDLRIGLDVARLSLLHLVDDLVFVTGDSDFIPVFKFARREGVRVYLDCLDGSVKSTLKAHADRLIVRGAAVAP